MREEDLLRLRWVADPRVSPDGERVVFTLVSVDIDADAYRTELWLAEVPVAGASPIAPRALTTSGRDSQARWSPDGSHIAFVRKADAEADAQLHVLPMRGGEARSLTSLRAGVSSPAWSPDGSRIAFLSGHDPARDTAEAKKPKNAPARVVTHPEFRWNGDGFVDLEHLDHLWVIGVEGGEPQRLTCGDRFKESSPVWSRDGRWILYTTDRRPQPWFGQPVEDAEVRAISPDLTLPSDGSDTVLVADIAGPLGPFAEGPSGQLLAIGGIRPSPARSYDQNTLLHFKGEWPLTHAIDLAASLDVAVGEGISSDQHPPRGGGDLPLGFIEQGNAAVFVHAHHGASQLARVDLRSGAIEALTPADREVIQGDVSADGRRVALTLGGLTTPGDLYVHELGTGTLTRLFGPNDAVLESVGLGAVEEIWYESFDGRRIQGWVVKPADFDPTRRYPLVLEIHGGPHAAYGVGFSHEFRMLAQAGYVVLYTNPRGSTSYGQEFANCIQYAYPGHDYDDLMAGVDHMLATGYIDEARMGVTGGSGGGLLTNWIITRTDRFRAAITQRCVSDWSSMWYSSDFAMFNAAWFRKAPFEDPNEFAERSPATYLDRVKTPLMVIHSEEDWRTPIAQGEVMFRGLLKQGKPAVMVRFPGENHELSRSGAPSRRVQNQQHIRRWFDHWLQGKPAPEYGV